jgi:Tfp pilus assembly protein PilO
MSLPSIEGLLPQLRLLLSSRENRRLRTAVLAFASLLGLVLLLYGVLVVPSSATLSERERRHADLRKRHAEAVLFKKQKESFAGIRAGIPAQKDMPILIKELVQTARKLKLAVATVNYDIPRPGGQGLTMLSFSFPVEGSYPNVKRFIYEIESSERLIGIQDLKLDGDRGRVRLQLKLVTYIREE